MTDVVLDILAENLDQNIDSEGKILEDSAIQEKLGKLITAKPNEIVVLHDSKAIRKVLSTFFMKKGQSNLVILPLQRLKLQMHLPFC